MAMDKTQIETAIQYYIKIQTKTAIEITDWDHAGNVELKNETGDKKWMSIAEAADLIFYTMQR